MSSLRNAVQRRNHRERDQPSERKKWGLLEKRKDYKLRAADHKSKQKKIKALSQKASQRNEDEFAFGMVNAQSRNGVKIAKRGEGNGGGRSLDVDVVRLMKTQDLGYLRTQRQRVRKERGRLEREVVVMEAGVRMEPDGRRRKVFGSDGEEEEVEEGVGPGQQRDGDRGEMHVDGRDAGEGGSNPDDSDADDAGLTPGERSRRQARRHALGVTRRKLSALREQEEKLSAAQQALEHQRAKMNGTVGGINKNGQRFKMRRKR